MVDVAVAITNLVANTATAALAGSGTAFTTGQTGSFPANNKTDDLMLIIEETGAANLTIVFDAGAYPPSMRQGLGTLTITLTSGQIKALMLEGGRYIQTTGLITCTVTGTCKIRALRLPIHPVLSAASTPTTIS